MTTDAVNAPAIPATRVPRFTRKQLVVAAVIAGTLVLAGGTTAGAIAYSNAAAAAQAAHEAEVAAEAARVEATALALYSSGYKAAAVQAATLVADATAIGDSGSPLVSAADAAALGGLSTSLSALLEQGIPAGADSAAARAAFVELDGAVTSARAQLETSIAGISAAAQAAHDAYTLADAASLQGIVDASSALVSAAANRHASADAFTALTAAVAAAGTSHDAGVAAAAQAAAQAAAAAGGKKTYTYNGQTYSTGGGPSAPPITAPPTGGGPVTPGAPTYTDADARAAVVNAYGAQAKGADCDVLNSGTWSAGSTPPAPALRLIAAGGWLGFTAYSIGNGGSVQYYGCY